MLQQLADVLLQEACDAKSCVVVRKSPGVCVSMQVGNIHTNMVCVSQVLDQVT